jgi:hypothetical protein
MEPSAKIMEQTELEQKYENGSAKSPITTEESPIRPYNDSIPDSTTLGGGSTQRSDDTPTEPKPNLFELPATPNFTPLDENINYPKISTQAQNYTTTVMNNDDKTPDTPPRVGPKPPNMAPQSAELPAVDGREGDLWTLPSQQHYGDFKLKHPLEGEEGDDWPQEALMHMNLAHR